MKSKYVISAIGLSGILLLSGCQSAMQAGALIGAPQDSVAAITAKHNPTNPEKIAVFLGGEKPNKPYTVIGQASVDQTTFYVPRTESAKLKILKEQAAKIGGDAVVNINEGLTAMTGSVIKYRTVG